MFHTKDYKTLDMFDPFEHLGPRRRKLLESSWAHLFREEVLPELPVQKLLLHYSELQGRPTKELYAMLGLMILQQMHDLTDDDAVDQFTFNKKWHYALNITGESDEEAYVSPKTLWSIRKILTEHNLYLPLFESVTAKLAVVFNVDTSKQRIDSVHIQSNMRHLGRVGLFVATIKKFLRNLKRHHKGLFDVLDKELTDRYMSKKGESAFSMVKPSESSRTLETLANDLFYLVDRFRKLPGISSMTSYQLLVRLLKEQCIVEDDGETGKRKASVKPNRDVPSDSLQSPSDPDAGYSGHKGKGYQVQVAETYENSEEKSQPSLITHISVEPANKSDAKALIPFIEDTKNRDLGPEEVLADTLYGGDENVEKAASEMSVEVVSPVKGPEPGKDKSVSLTDFTLAKRGKVTSCPQGHAPLRTKHKKERHSAAFDKETCSVFLKATGVNILRAATFRNRKIQDNGPYLPHSQLVLGLIDAVKELLSSTMDDFRKMIRQSYIGNQLPEKTAA
ncbi:MAG: transposase [bacterium]|nr:transposase [bacterium]